MRRPRESTRFQFSHDCPDVTQGEHHLMAEALLGAKKAGIPPEIICRAVDTLNRLERMAGGVA